MTLYFTNETIQIYRMRNIGGLNKWSVSATFTAFVADIQPASPERLQLESGQIGHMFTAFLPVEAEVKEGDQIRIIDTGKIYQVKGVNNWSGAGMLDHKELILTSEDDK